MPKLTPLQEVKNRFGSKEELAKQLIPILDREEGVDDQEFERRIKTASNKQLLRMHRTQEILKRRYGSKEALVKAIEVKKFPAGNEAYRTKLMAQRTTRLLDLLDSLR